MLSSFLSGFCISSRGRYSFVSKKEHTVHTYTHTHTHINTTMLAQIEMCKHIKMKHSVIHNMQYFIVDVGQMMMKIIILIIRKMAGLLFVTLVQLSYPPYFLPVVYPLLHDYGKC